MKLACKRLSALLILALVCLAQPAAAQDTVTSSAAAPAIGADAPTPAATQQTDPNATTSSNAVEKVVVTATRRSDLITKVPESITAFMGAKMDALGAKSFADLAAFTPGVDYDPVSNNISIRGIHSNTGAGTTGIYIDDTPIQMRVLGLDSNNNTLPAVFDLDRVEVLRGPQGTLFGAGSEGGTVRYITPQASLTDDSVYARTELSGTSGGGISYEAGAAVGGPIVTDELGFRVSLWRRRDGGWIDAVDYSNGKVTDPNANRTDIDVVRATLLWQPTASLTITPGIFYQDRNQNDAAQYWVGISNPADGNFRTGTPERLADRDRYVLPSLKIGYDVGGAQLISNTSFFDRRELVNGYSATLYNLSYLQQLVDGFTDPNGNACPGGLCAIFAAEHGADPNFQAPALLTPIGPNLLGFGPYRSVATIQNMQQNFTQEVRLQSTDTDAPLTWILGLAGCNQNFQIRSAPH